MSHVKKPQLHWGMLIVLIISFAIFTWFGWFVLHPTTVVAIISTLSFGLGLTLGIYWLAYADGRARTRLSRFGIDLGIGWLLMAFIYLYMLGFVFEPFFIMAGAAVVLVLAALFALRKHPQYQRISR
ncbi:hypothetical protein [Lacticaseibacillus nasuensis]|nr:hypothetical protein [Lacticaseibacillus nasuensis]